MRTTIRSDSTRVPPVTALRSPPASRMTGADSPVIADSSTDAMPSTMSPSPGMTSSGLDDDPVADLAAGWPRPPTPCRRRPAAAADGVGAGGAQRGGLRLAATLGHRLGEVAEQDREPQPGGDGDGERARVGDGRDGRRDRAEQHEEHHRRAPQVARVERPGSCRAPCERSAPRSCRRRPVVGVCGSRRWAGGSGVRGVSCEGLSNRSEGERREVGEAGHDEDDADQHPDEEGLVGGEGAGGDRAPALLGQRAGERSTSTIGRSRPTSIARPPG